jgi:predicted transglutaminase-like protease|eukprot:COSAG06_NODE_61_length_27084_cov_48.281490_23_plen_44_part_00
MNINYNVYIINKLYIINTQQWLAKIAKEEPDRPWAIYFAPHAP